MLANHIRNSLDDFRDKNILSFLRHYETQFKTNETFQTLYQNFPFVQNRCFRLVGLWFGNQQPKKDGTVAVAVGGGGGGGGGKSIENEEEQHNSLSTYNYRIHQMPKNGHSKGIYDVSRINKGYFDVNKYQSIHNPWGNKVCGPTNPYFHSGQDFQSALLRINHYLGPLENYLARRGGARSRSLEDYNRKLKEGGPYSDEVDTSIDDWLTRFKQKVGNEAAKKLLFGPLDLLERDQTLTTTKSTSSQETSFSVISATATAPPPPAAAATATAAGGGGPAGPLVNNNNNPQESQIRYDNYYQNDDWPWMKNLSAGIPTTDRGVDVIISFGVCCYQQAQKDTEKEFDTKYHKHGKKRYDMAAVLAASLWKLKEPRAQVIVVLAYVGSDEGSIQQLQKVKSWLERVGAKVWEYDVSQFPDQSFACIRVAQLGRMYLHESRLLHENDFVMMSDADVFPIQTNILLRFLNVTNPDGDYHRVTIPDFHRRVKPGAPFPSIKLFGVGQAVADWHRSFHITGLPTLKTAVDYAYKLKNYTYGTWFADQTIFTYALMNSELCSFPQNYIFWNSEYQGNKDLLVVSFENSTSSLRRDEYTCFKQQKPHRVCYNKFVPEKHCTWAHFSAEATVDQMFNIYKAIIVSANIPGRKPKTPQELFKKTPE